MIIMYKTCIKFDEIIPANTRRCSLCGARVRTMRLTHKIMVKYF